MCPDTFGPRNVSTPFYTTADMRNYCATSAPYQIPAASSSYDPLNMNYSIYGTDIDLASDYTKGVGSYGYGGYAGGGYVYNPELMYQQMDRWTDYMYDRNVKYIEKGRANDARINTPFERAQNAADALTEKVVKDEQSQIPQFFEAYKQAIKDLYPQYANLSDKALTARALEHYKQRNNNVALKDSIRANGNNMFLQKFWNTFTLGLASNGSTEETIEEITGNPMAREDKIKGSIGTGAGVAALATTGVLAFNNRKAIWNVAKRNPLTLAILAGATALGWLSYGKSGSAD